MIINTGQRTDIPAFYAEWFSNRLKEGFVCVRNPYNPNQVSRYRLDPAVAEAGYDFSYHNLVCPQAAFARQYGYGEYMPYICNLDYVMFGVLGAPLYREHTCFEDGDCCDFKLKLGADVLPYWPPVFSQDNPYK